MIERLDVVDLLFFRGTGRGAIFSPHLQLLRWTMRRMLIWKSNTTTMKLSYASRRRRKRWGGCSWEKEVEAEGHTFAVCGEEVEAQGNTSGMVPLPCVANAGLTPAQGGSIDNPSEEFKARYEQYVGVYGGNKYKDGTRERKQFHFCSRKGTYSYCYGCRRFLCSEPPLNGKDRRVPKVLQ